MKRLYATLCYLVVAICGYAQAVGDYRSTGNVTFGANTNWEVLTALPSTWTAASTAPAAASLSSANTVTVLAAHTISYPAPVAFASNNDFMVLIQGTINTSGAFTVSYGNGLSTVKIERSANLSLGILFTNQTFRKLVLEGTAGTPTFTFTSALTVTNSLTVNNANLVANGLTLSGNTVTVNASGNINFSAAQTISNSQLTMNFTGNGRTLTYQNPLTLSGTPGSTVNVNFSGTGGIVNVNGNYSSTNSTFNLSGSGAILSNSGAAPVLAGSVINLQSSSQQISFPNANSISLSGNSLIKLLAASGKMNLGNSSSFTGADANNYIQLGSTSTVSRQIGNNSSFTYPIGTTSYYLPLGVTNTQGGANNRQFAAGVFTGVTLDATPGGTPVAKASIVDAVWTLSQNGNSANSVTINTTWQSALEGSVFAGFTTLSQIGISQGREGSTTWSTAVLGSGGNRAGRNFISNALSIPVGVTSAFVIGQVNQNLPILLKNFTASVINQHIKLQWVALATSMDGYFEVERSTSADGKFQPLGKVAVQKVGDAIYSYIDDQPVATISYYRIRSVDENGFEVYSKTVRVNLNETPFMLNQVYPTICQETLNLSVNSDRTDKLHIRIMDMSGRLAWVKDLQAGKGTNSYSLDLSQLSGGQYILVVNNGEQIQTSRFIKK